MKAILISVLPFVGYPYVGESVPCNLCGSSDSVRVSRTDRRWKRLTTVACRECGLLRTDPMPTDAELEAYYRSQYRLEYQLATSGPPKPHIVRSTREAERRAEQLKPWLKSGAKVLDFGCGTGEFLRLARDLGCDVLGVEPGEAYAQHARREHDVNVLSVPWRALDFDHASFDVITAHHVLEHLRDPVDAIAAMTWWLKEDGVAYFSVPDMRPNHKPSFERFHFAHVHGFIPATLEAAALRHGLEPVGGESLSRTTGIFARSGSSDRNRHDDTVVDRQRTVELARDYAEGSIFRYVASGRHLRAAAGRLRKWVKDSAA